MLFQICYCNIQGLHFVTCCTFSSISVTNISSSILVHIETIQLTFIYRAIIGVITYFVVGGIYMYQAKEARGLDVIPNLAFWKDLPFLIKVLTHNSTFCIEY